MTLADLQRLTISTTESDGSGPERLTKRTSSAPTFQHTLARVRSTAVAELDNIRPWVEALRSRVCAALGTCADAMTGVAGNLDTVSSHAQHLKHTTQRVVRGVHARFFDRGLPDRIALVSHGLPSQHRRPFREMVSFFVQQGYVFTDPEGIQSGHHRKCVLISFDDCFRDWYESLDLFDDLSIKATFYVNTLPLRDLADNETMSHFRDRIRMQRFEPLSSDELVALRARGHTIGSHSHSHFDLASLLPDKAREEILIGKSTLERIIGGRIDHFAYPYGMRRHFTRTLRDMCVESGFKTIASGMPGQLHAPSAGLLHRTHWNFDEPLEHNLQNLRIDGRVFERLTGRSPIG